MKLFKKLAAAALAAVLALSMVGCGSSKTDLAQQVKNAVSDLVTMEALRPRTAGNWMSWRQIC